jgi:hypothetical protein
LDRKTADEIWPGGFGTNSLMLFVFFGMGQGDFSDVGVFRWSGWLVTETDELAGLVLVGVGLTSFEVDDLLTIYGFEALRPVVERSKGDLVALLLFGGVFGWDLEGFVNEADVRTAVIFGWVKAFVFGIALLRCSGHLVGPRT